MTDSVDLILTGLLQFTVGVMQHLQKMLHAIPARWHEQRCVEQGSSVLHMQHSKFRTEAGAGKISAGNGTGRRVLVGLSAFQPYSVAFITGGSDSNEALYMLAW